MNKFALILGVALGALVLRAQTNSDIALTNATAPPGDLRIEGVALVTNAPAKAPPEIRITSDGRGEMNLNTRVAIHRVNVVVTITDPVMRLTCDVLTIRVPNEGEKPDHILAEGHVIIDYQDEDGKKTHGTGEKALYTYNVTGSTTNETITLSGNAHLERESDSQDGESITWDLVTNVIHVTRPDTTIRLRSSSTNTPAGTNAPAATNTPAGMNTSTGQ